MSNLKKMIRVASVKSLITPRLTGWLANHGEGVVVEDEETAALLVRLASPGKSRSGAFHPSQLYQCPRRQMFDFHGVAGLKAYNPQLQNIFNDGTWRHMRWQIMLLNAGILTRAEVGVEFPQYNLQGSVDGLNDDERWMFELKGTSQYGRIKKSGQPLDAHTKQINAYLWTLGLDRCVVIYEDKSSQDWTEMEVHRDEKIVLEVTDILEGLNTHLSDDSLPEVLDDCKVGQGTAFQNCPYAHICRKAKTGEDAIKLSEKFSG